MGREELSSRDIWQDYSGEYAGIAEHRFYDVFDNEFEGTNFRIIAKPNEFKDIYVNVELPAEELNAIYTPPDPIIRHGIIPDYAIVNIKTHKRLYVEVKRQDGWVEGKPRSAGRGNAHERACKLFTPGLMSIMRQSGRIEPPALPFWIVFQGDITRDPCRVREIHCWFADKPAHFFLWRDNSGMNDIIAHFNTQLKPFLF
jgi:hypothetical protein